jgi:hypothetical protein
LPFLPFQKFRDVFDLCFHWHFLLNSSPKLGTKKKNDQHDFIERF